MIKIKMLTTQYDNETNELVWKEGDVFDVILDYSGDFYRGISVNSRPYGIGVECEGIHFTKEEDNE